MIQKACYQASPSLARSTANKGLHSSKNKSPGSIVVMTILRAKLPPRRQSWRNTDSGLYGQSLI